MATMQKHAINVSYTKKHTEQHSISTNVEQTPIELAHGAMLRFFEQQYPGDTTIPDSFEVNGQVFSYAEVQAYARREANGWYFLNPAIELKLDAAAVHAGDPDDSTPGQAIAAILRAAASEIEKDIQIVPYGSGVWQRETHHYKHATLILDETEKVQL